MKSEDRHGGNIHAAARVSGLPRRRLIDFSASINPLGPSRRALRAMIQTLPDVRHYPDPDCLDLRLALADRHGMDPARLMIGNGSSEFIHLLPAVLSIRLALIVGPTFSEYERAVRMVGGRVSRLQARRADEYRPSLARAVAAMCGKGNRNRPDAVFFCNPNSPTGQAVSKEELYELIEAANRRKVRVIVDETFVDYCEERSILPQSDKYPCLVVLRSFTKFFGLPGLRVGYVIAPRETIARIREQQAPWSVNSVAQAAARAALEDEDHAQASRTFMRAERGFLARHLGAVPGLRVYPSAANFLMVELPPPCSAARLTSILRSQGLLIRDLSSVVGLTRRMVRLAVRTRPENRRLLWALRNVRNRFAP